MSVELCSDQSLLILEISYAFFSHVKSMKEKHFFCVCSENIQEVLVLPQLKTKLQLNS